MKKLALLLALAFAAPVFAEPTMLPSHAVGSLLHSISPAITIEALAYSATTTSSTNSGRIVYITADSGGAVAPTTVADGINLEGLYGLTVIIEAGGTMTAGGTLQCYIWNPQTAAWARNPDLDLTVAALTKQAFPGLFIASARGRATWVPNGVGSVTTAVYLIGSERP